MPRSTRARRSSCRKATSWPSNPPTGPNSMRPSSPSVETTLLSYEWRREGTAFCDRSLLRKHQLKIVYVVHSDNAA
jgi:hypothetical protein